MLSKKNTEELLSSVVFLFSCLKRVEERLGLVEGRLRDLEAEHDRLSRHSLKRGQLASSAPDSPVRQVAGAIAAQVANDHAVTRIGVIVPVHNAPEDTARCLDALFENGGYSTLIVIDDGSDQETAQLLDTLATRREFCLVRNPRNLGYTRSINIGVGRATDVDALVILNSDTLVTIGWIDRIAAAFNANPRAGVVGPWSNAATYQSLPDVKDGSGRFAVNRLRKDLVPDDLALALRERPADYPRVPVINGFCFAVRRALFDEIGAFDEASFPIGYGEENDFCIRAANAGYEIIVADDAYVFHAKSKSFGAERRNELARAGRAALEKKHGAERVRTTIATIERSPALDEARVSSRRQLDLAAPGSLCSWFRDSIAYVLPARPGGGGVHSIMQEAGYLAEQGVRARVFVPADQMASFRAFYGDRADGIIAPYRNTSHLTAELRPYSVIVATVYRSIPLVQPILSAGGKRIYYYVQDYEPFFHPIGSEEHAKALATYEIDQSCVLFAKTRWLQQIVRERHKRDVRLVLPSLDHATFFPGSSPAPHNRVAAMVRPSTPRRSPAETVELARALASGKRGRLSVALFGCDADDPILEPVRRLKSVEIHGKLKREQVASLLRSSDVFLDLSVYQAFGRTSIEGMACGCVPIVPAEGGSAEFASPGWNAFSSHVQNADFIADCTDKIGRIYVELNQFKQRCIETAARYSIAAAGKSILKVFAGV